MSYIYYPSASNCCNQALPVTVGCQPVCAPCNPCGPVVVVPQVTYKACCAPSSCCPPTSYYNYSYGYGGACYSNWC